MVSKKNKRVALTLSLKNYNLYKKVSEVSNTSLSKVIDYALHIYAKERVSDSEIYSLVNK